MSYWTCYRAVFTGNSLQLLHRFLTIPLKNFSWICLRNFAEAAMGELHGASRLELVGLWI